MFLGKLKLTWQTLTRSGLCRAADGLGDEFFVRESALPEMDTHIGWLSEGGEFGFVIAAHELYMGERSGYDLMCIGVKVELEQMYVGCRVQERGRDNLNILAGTHTKAVSAEELISLVVRGSRSSFVIR
jgi:hypothetical protein